MSLQFTSFPLEIIHLILDQRHWDHPERTRAWINLMRTSKYFLDVVPGLMRDFWYGAGQLNGKLKYNTAYQHVLTINFPNVKTIYLDDWYIEAGYLPYIRKFCYEKGIMVLNLNSLIN